ncbi:hypothetical protein [Pseudonocardia lacus]|uniref:hypothetical protein n=1 Tax=Pseudonocardia lacus TaxID=2835865 RepID=UPI001BDBEDFF|nr:hypothetical protein [Pseudonocardia lacus]
MSTIDDLLPAPRMAPAASAGVSMSVRGPRHAVLTVTGDAGPAVVRLVEVMLDTILADGVRHVIADLSAVSAVPPSLGDALSSVARVLERRGGWLLVEGGAAVGWPEDDGGVLLESSLLDAFQAYRASVQP